MLEVKDLTRYYGNKCAVDHISFQLKKGQITGLLGRNGAGKSTTMNMITGYLVPTEGSIKVDGISFSSAPVKAKEKIGYLPEKPPLYPDLTVKEYLEFMYRIKKVRLPQKRHITEICNMVKIEAVQNRLIRNLSKGYGQRVGIAQALLGYPPLIILDEPTVGLDPQQIVEIRSIISNMGKEHSVILSSHILSEVQAVCDRGIIIDHGKIIFDEDLEKIKEKDKRKFRIGIKGPLNEIRSAVENMDQIQEIVELNEGEEGVVCLEAAVAPEYKDHHGILRGLLDKGWGIEYLYWCRPDLEEVFMALTDENRRKQE